MDALRYLARHPEIAIHVASALAALALGLFILWGRKGSTAHRWLGRSWVALMGTAAVSSAFISGGLPNLWGFSPIHLLTVLTLWHLPRGVWYARRGNLAAHRATMRNLYIGGCLVAGMFTLLPGRFLGHLVWS